MEQEVKIAMFLELFSLLRGELLSLSTLSRGNCGRGWECQGEVHAPTLAFTFRVCL